ncbi:hypothetical protein AVEN_248938-1 [Araneus ventricosus]|uniref:Uncharacterized protein n=1 Tax=Araneus ventricosus TaxID=182803 RepID=A0A4Y2PKM4_ARAVE|nr:hypothetical protein AVEN_248938-1 [Araneus ventricosus]
MIGRSKEVDWTETSVQFLRTVVIAYASWVDITTAINPKKKGLGYRSILFHCFRKAYYRERDLFFSPTLSGGPNFLPFKGLTCHRASWQPRQSATGSTSIFSLRSVVEFPMRSASRPPVGERSARPVQPASYRRDWKGQQHLIPREKGNRSTEYHMPIASVVYR